MRKRFSILTLVLLWSVVVYGTHNRAGFISYTHISGLTYEAEITTYTVPDSPADRPSLALDWGDGQVDTIARSNGGGFGVIVAEGTKESKYVAQHTYSSVGDYLLSLKDPNRNAGIQNIPNSVNVPFYVESELKTSVLNSVNSSTRPAGLVNFNAYVGIPLVQNLAFYDLDADFLSFSLVNPRGEGGLPINGYSIPVGVSVNPLSGDFVWESPEETGEFAFAMQVNEFRGSTLIGTVIVDFQVVVLPQGDSIGVNVFGTNDWPTNQHDDFSITVQPNETIELTLGYDNSEADSVSQIAFGEPFINGNLAQFVSDSSSLTYQENSFSWTPSSANARCAPYIVCFRSALSAHQALDIGLLIYVHDQAVLSNPECMVFAGIEDDSSTSPWVTSVFPNPVSESATIEFSSKNVMQVDFQLFDSSARLVRNWRGTTDKAYQINREDLKSGLYMFRASFANGSFESGKVMLN